MATSLLVALLAVAQQVAGTDTLVVETKLPLQSSSFTRICASARSMAHRRRPSAWSAISLRRGTALEVLAVRPSARAAAEFRVR
jgi:hypothetical protein